jgi:hypothetical protein
VYYDQQTNKVFQISSGSVDYSTEYWYSLRINAGLRKNGLVVAGALGQTAGNSYTSVYSETQAETGAVFDAITWFDIVVEYQTYEVVAGCYSCSDWYDPFNYSFVSQKGEVIDLGITYGVWVWAAPTIVVSRTVSEVIQLGNTGGRANLPGPKGVFDLKVRAFIPVNWIWGPDACFVTHPTDGVIGMSTIYGGDGRDYNPFELTAYRGMSSIMLSSAGYILGIPFHNTGRTDRYVADALQSDGQTLKQDAVLHDCYLLDNWGRASFTNMHVAVSGSAPSISANFYAGISNPVSPPGVTPDINWNITIAINTTNPITPSYTVNYTHDCYPAYEVFHGAQPLYGYKPPGHNPLTNLAPCLYGFGQIVGSTAGTIF